MEIQKVSDAFSVTGQITSEDLTDIARLGFKTIVCNRPDKEGGEIQPLSATLSSAAESLGMQFVYLPFSPGQLTADEVKQFSLVLNSHQQPILGFCKTGNRSKTIFSAANASM